MDHLLGVMTHLAHLPNRAVLSITGADRVSFLNGLVSNDVSHAAPGRAVWAALLTPQGKYLADFFILADADRLLLDVEAAQRDLLALKLSRFRLRADVAIAKLDLAVHAAWNGPPPDILNGPPRDVLNGPPPEVLNGPPPDVLNGPPPEAVIAAPDPRLPDAGWRILSDAPLPTTADLTEWNLHRLRLGLPDGTSDLEPDKTVLLEAGFDELGGISWTKGCYMGQELTARTRYRGLLKRRLLPVSGTAPLPPPGTAVLAGDREAGTLRSVIGADALAVLRLDRLGDALTAAGVALNVCIPGWVKLPQDSAA